MHYYQHNIKDFNNATRHLTRVERALYREAIELYYDGEQPLTSDLSVLSRRLMVVGDDEKNALNYILSEFFYLDGDIYRNNRCDSELEKYHSNNSAKARAGKASAAARRKKKKALNSSDATESNRRSTPVQHIANEIQLNKEPRTINQEPLTINQYKNKNKKKENLSGKPDAMPGEQGQVFDYWVTAMCKGALAKPTKGRVTKIKARLNEGYSVEQIKQAIDGCSRSPFHMGENKDNKRYDDIELICRNGEKLESFIAEYSKPASPQSQREQEANDWANGVDRSVTGVTITQKQELIGHG